MFTRAYQMTRIARSLVIVASTSLASACAVGITRMYAGQRSLDEVSVIIWDPSQAARFEKLDGTDLPQNLMRVQRVEFLPGSHTFTIRVPRDNQATERVTITRETKPGRCYTLRNEVMAVSVSSNGRVLGPASVVPSISDTTAAACPMR